LSDENTESTAIYTSWADTDAIWLVNYCKQTFLKLATAVERSADPVPL